MMTGIYDGEPMYQIEPSKRRTPVRGGVVNTNTCPLGGDCGGTGWLWRGGSDYPYPEPPEWYPCKCNPRADGAPNELLDYAAMVDYAAIKGQREPVTVGADDAPF